MADNKMSSGVIFLQHLSSGKLDQARVMRKSPTRAENKMWQYLRRKNIAGVKFRRQQVIEGFIVDFFCHEAKLVIEIDGGIHDKEKQRMADAQRRAVFEARGLKELRFRNEEVLYDMTKCINTITAIVEQRSASRYNLLSPP